MTQSRAHLVTGVTGFLGGALLLKLLEEPDAEVWCVVRADDDQAATRRLHASIEKAVQVYGNTSPALVIGRCHALAGDVTRPDCGLVVDRLPRISHIWHAAATLRTEAVYAQEIRNTNVGGTRNAIGLARRLGAQLNHISTLSTSPIRSGTLLEEPPDATSVALNAYDAAKTDGEAEVAACGLPWRIIRPPMVTGHSRTYGATEFAGIYGFARRVWRFRLKHAAEASARPLAIRGLPDARLQLLPVDALVRCVADIGHLGPLCKRFNITNLSPPVVDDLYSAVFSWLKLPPPILVESVPEDDWLAMDLEARVGGHLDYFARNDRVDLTNCLSVVSADELRHPMDQDVLERLLDWYARQGFRSRYDASWAPNPSRASR
ncbi:SDR family oxidoreductase [Streptomyces chartreusis]|uniref:SDR family oxidoreductase n=1 Tax=Streptomyces chartreusis TaxID=1969 RepID=UPI0037FC9D41